MIHLHEFNMNIVLQLKNFLCYNKNLLIMSKITS